ncbi:MAG: hypothetical protein ACTSYI_08155 [Promethearchaeota archaeon]
MAGTKLVEINTSEIPISQYIVLTAALKLTVNFVQPAARDQIDISINILFDILMEEQGKLQILKI